MPDVDKGRGRVSLHSAVCGTLLCTVLLSCEVIVKCRGEFGSEVAVFRRTTSV